MRAAKALARSAHTHGADGFPGLGRLCDQDTREPETLWNGRFLPPVADLDVFPKK
jgi:hypothetical protein